MPLRFRRRIKIFPGVHLNISRSGISTSLGVRGVSVTIGKRGKYLNTGIPGTGVSWRTKIDSQSSMQVAAAPISQVTPALTPQGAPVHTHHLQWWKVLLFIVTMVLAGATKSQVVIGLFWIGWFGYWFFLAVRLGYRRMKA